MGALREAMTCPASVWEHQEVPCNGLNTDRRRLPPLPLNPCSISGSDQSAQTSASSTRKQQGWSSYNPAPSPPPFSWLLVTDRQAEMLCRRQLDACPSHLHTGLHQSPSMGKGRPKQAALQGTVMVCCHSAEYQTLHVTVTP